MVLVSKELNRGAHIESHRKARLKPGTRALSPGAEIIELRGRYFTPPYPADTIAEVTSLYSPQALIEIEAIAVPDEAAERT